MSNSQGLALKWRSNHWGELRKEETNLGLAGAILEDNSDNCPLSIRKQSSNGMSDQMRIWRSTPRRTFCPEPEFRMSCTGRYKLPIKNRYAFVVWELQVVISFKMRVFNLFGGVSGASEKLRDITEFFPGKINNLHTYSTLDTVSPLLREPNLRML